MGQRPLLILILVAFAILAGTTTAPAIHLQGYNPNPHPHRLPEKIHVWDYADPPVELAFLDYEEYVQDVLPNEWDRYWGDSALWAGAIACRTYSGNSENWRDLDSDGYPQIWDDSHAQNWRPGRRTPGTEEAVDNTTGLFMIYNGAGDGTGPYLINYNNVLSALYDGLQGPRTSSVTDYPYLSGVEDPVHMYEPAQGHGFGACQHGTQDWATDYNWRWSQSLYHYYTYFQFQQQDGVVGYYYDDHDGSGNCLHPGTYFNSYQTARSDNPINFNWGQGSWDANIPDCFSIRWQGSILSNEEGWYTFYVTADDGARLWVDDHLLIDEWRDQGTTTFSGAIKLPWATSHAVKLEYYEQNGDATVRLSWLPGQGLAGYYFSEQATLDPTLPETAAELQ